jgi:hypothetical protein
MNFLINRHPTAMVIKYLTQVYREEPKFSRMCASTSQIGLTLLWEFSIQYLLGFNSRSFPALVAWMVSHSCNPRFITDSPHAK